VIAVVQRVSSARVVAQLEEGSVHKAAIGCGLLALVCAVQHDTETEAQWIADKIASLRIFSDEAGKMNRSAIDERASVLVVSQFTLAGELKKGTRPSFTRAAAPNVARPLVDYVAERLAGEHGLTVETGVFGTSMQAELVNDGPVTIILERPPKTE
jgi:D-aminoacyl-tRNA deacylase